MEQHNETFDFEAAMHEATRRAVEAPHDTEERISCEGNHDSFVRVQKRNGKLRTEFVAWSVDLGDVDAMVRDEQAKIYASLSAKVVRLTPHDAAERG